jgi:hypothetical protein
MAEEYVVHKGRIPKVDPSKQASEATAAAVAREEREEKVRKFIAANSPSSPDPETDAPRREDFPAGLPGAGAYNQAKLEYARKRANTDPQSAAVK